MPVLVTDIASAELIKHAANSFLALKITFANAVADVCEAAGADILEVVKGVGLDKRIGRAFLNAGLGFGGSCFPKDLRAFVKIAERTGYDFTLLKEVTRLNAQRAGAGRREAPPGPLDPPGEADRPPGARLQTPHRRRPGGPGPGPRAGGCSPRGPPSRATTPRRA